MSKFTTVAIAKKKPIWSSPNKHARILEESADGTFEIQLYRTTTKRWITVAVCEFKELPLVRDLLTGITSKFP